MSRYAPTIHTDPARIAALEALLPQLRGQTHVEITLDDGTRLLGTVAVQPTLQQYRDADENEGSNGQLRLDDLDSRCSSTWCGSTGSPASASCPRSSNPAPGRPA